MTSSTVIVLMPTYNHEKCIGQAIESVLFQITTFDVHLYISDDASIDSTFLIASSFQSQNKVRITSKRNESNLGAITNGEQLRNFAFQSDSKYVSILEGDDYWIDPYKLQKQVDFLEANPDFAICYHPTKILMPNGDLIDDFIAEKYFKAPESSIFDLAIYGNYIHTPSVVFRKDDMLITENLVLSPTGDYYLYLLASQKGKLRRLDFSGAVYRYGIGSHSSLELKERKYLRQKTLRLASSDMNNPLISFILKLRIHHNSLLGKMDHVILRSSGVKNIFSFLMFINKLELIKAIIKLLLYKRIKL
jgi:glycosyltransferase involved in cell wall biosynthesis